MVQEGDNIGKKRERNGRIGLDVKVDGYKEKGKEKQLEGDPGRTIEVDL